MELRKIISVNFCFIDKISSLLWWWVTGSVSVPVAGGHLDYLYPGGSQCHRLPFTWSGPSVGPAPLNTKHGTEGNY